MKYSLSKRFVPALAVFGLVGCQMVSSNSPQSRTREVVGRLGSNRFYTPVNQVLTPAGLQVELPGMRPQALALSPDGKLLVTPGKTHELVVINPGSSTWRPA